MQIVFFDDRHQLITKKTFRFKLKHKHVAVPSFLKLLSIYINRSHPGHLGLISGYFNLNFNGYMMHLHDKLRSCGGILSLLSHYDHHTLQEMQFMVNAHLKATWQTYFYTDFQDQLNTCETHKTAWQTKCDVEVGQIQSYATLNRQQIYLLTQIKRNKKCNLSTVYFYIGGVCMRLRESVCLCVGVYSDE